MGTTMAEHPKVPSALSWRGSGATGPAAPFLRRWMGLAVSLGERRVAREQRRENGLGAGAVMQEA